MTVKKVSRKNSLNSKAKSILLATLFLNGRIGILEKEDKKNSHFRFSWSDDGIVFNTDYEEVIFVNGLLKHNPDQCSNFRFSNIGKKIYATYTRVVRDKVYRVIAEYRDIYEWEVISEVLAENFESILISDVKSKKTQILYENGSFVKCLISNNWEDWKDDGSLLFTTRHDRFDKTSLKLLGGFVSDKGILVFYESLIPENDSYKIAIGLVIFDIKNPRKIIWRSNDPIWKSDVSFSRHNICDALGVVVNEKDIYFYFNVDNTLITVSLLEDDLSLHIPSVGVRVLSRHKKNPIISPHPHNKWENEAIFNPATLIDDSGHIHLIYRAIGSDGVSRLGYGFSEDGIHFNGRLNVPIFSMGNPREEKIIKIYDPVLYPSGGSWGGCEDPRAVRIDGRIYITFNAFDGWDFIRIGVVSIDEKDFFDKKWKWSKPILISPPRQIHKNWVLFPEKIDNKFAILHSISPKVQIDFINKLEDLEKGKYVIKSQFKQDTSKKGWDTWVRGVGPPPLKTDKGWLILYHAMDHRDPNKYKLGAMLLDLKDPRKVISRSKEPILEPEMWYENDWKPGVVYSCGALIKDDMLYVYYGGGDKHVCVATSPLEKVFNKLTQ